MKLFFTIVYIRIITLILIFYNHPLVEYPLYRIIQYTSGQTKKDKPPYSNLKKKKKNFPLGIF